MKKSKFISWASGLAMAALLAIGTADVKAQSLQLSNCTATTAFSPGGGSLALIVETISGARKSIRMSTYSFTEPSIGKALLDAHKRGVDVAIVVDKEHNGRRPPGSPSVARFLTENGVKVFQTRAFSIQHNKVIVVDGETVQTGSFNFSRAAEKSNAENVLVITKCPRLAELYLKDWEKLYRSTQGEGVS